MNLGKKLIRDLVRRSNAIQTGIKISRARQLVSPLRNVIPIFQKGLDEVRLARALRSIEHNAKIKRIIRIKVILKVVLGVAVQGHARDSPVEYS